METTTQTRHPIPHYYGDIIRKHLLLAGGIVLLAAIYDRELLNFYLVVGVFGVLTFTVLAGLISPRVRLVVGYVAILSAVMFLLFEYFAINAYLQVEDIFRLVFVLREALAVIFLSILYFSTKTVRGMPTLN